MRETEQKSSSAQLTTSQETEPIPEEWTNDPTRLRRSHHTETVFAASYGLTNISVLLKNTPVSGEFGYIFSCNGRYYFGDTLSDCMGEITKPTTYSGILHVLNTKGVNGLRTRWLEMILEPGPGPETEPVEMPPSQPEVNLFVPFKQSKGCKTCAKLDAANSQCKP
ncbi:hypothetical protein ASPBRDRAFT_208755 [Aspergillus brasiliensis CBS 101740]|uniref:Uncharacterized protein n=1 Tax=Aspergillus brasiliensis (strain CBS 101740 / IMI 381727 / IBT 21946) TaxID=767769 RepID=A0A1L9UEJ3_ASPBC|nr:hypothetical protein ASPBRDRAFT_208755 [Aspergillus brasiliensis CBS 101740]